MLKKIIFYFTLLICCLVHSVYAGAGETGAEFLLIGAGARPSAMGGAFVSVADDINAVQWNPAGMAMIRGREITATHSKWLSGINYGFVGYSHSGGKSGSFGISAIYLYMEDMIGRSLSGNETNPFGAYDISINLSYGRRILKDVSLGASMKFIQQNIEEEYASNIAFDFGGLYEICNSKIIIGGSLLNLGPKMKFVKEEFLLPLTLNLGIGYKFNSTLFALDIKYGIYEEDISLNTGAEYRLMDFFVLRGGYIIRLTPALRELDGITDMSAGAGFNFNDYKIDYAFVPFADLGNTHRISFTTKF